jgi:hypothetical protein
VALLDALVRAGHARRRRVLVHALTHATAEQAVHAGADGLTHLFVDEVTDDVVDSPRTAGTRGADAELIVTRASDPGAAALVDDRAAATFVAALTAPVTQIHALDRHSATLLDAHPDTPIPGGCPAASRTSGS